MKTVIESIKNLFVPPVKTRTVLVVDDSEIDRRIAADILAKHFYILTACNGRQGVEMAREKKPDLILLDFMMPDLKGPEVCRILKGENATKNIPIIFLTSLDTPASVIDSFEEGAEIFLTKPINRSQLLKQVNSALDYAAK